MRIIVGSAKEKKALIKVLKYLHDIRPVRQDLTEYQDQVMNDLVHTYLSEAQHLIEVEKNGR